MTLHPCEKVYLQSRGYLMKTFQRPQFALTKKSDGNVFYQLSTSEILLIKSTLSSAELNDTYVYDPALRKWVSLDSALEFKDVEYKFERNVKAPPLTAPSSSAPNSSPPNPQKVSPQAPRPQEVKVAAPAKSAAPMHSPAAKPIVKPPEPVKNEIIDEKTEIVPIDSATDISISVKKIMPNSSPQSDNMQKSVFDSISGKSDAAANFELDNNPFSSLKKAFNREKLNPETGSLERNPLIPVDSNSHAGGLDRKKSGKEIKWVDISSKKILLEPVIHYGFRAQIIKISYPFMMLDRPLEVKPGSVFKAIAKYSKQDYKIDLASNIDYPENNVVELKESGDFRFFKDLLVVIGAC